RLRLAGGDRRQRRAFGGPDLAVGAGRLARPAVEDDPAQDRLPDQPRDFDDARIGKELLQIALYRRRLGHVRRAEVDQQHADPGRGDGWMVRRAVHARAPITIGRVRTRWPVSAKKALATAGAAGGTPSSVTPPGASSLSSNSTDTSGASRKMGRP